MVLAARFMFLEKSCGIHVGAEIFQIDLNIYIFILNLKQKYNDSAKDS